MKKEDLLKVYAFAGAMWSSFKLPTTELEARLFDEVWYGILKPYSVELIITSIQQYATENDFCNIAKIGAICKKYTEIKNGTYIDEDTVLSNIRKAVSWNKSKKNFEGLSEFEKEIVGGPHMLARWSQSDVLDSVIMSNLRKQVHSKLQMKQQQEILQLNSQCSQFLKIEGKE